MSFREMLRELRWFFITVARSFLVAVGFLVVVAVVCVIAVIPTMIGLRFNWPMVYWFGAEIFWIIWMCIFIGNWNE